jgi:hypothetical protein
LRRGLKETILEHVPYYPASIKGYELRAILLAKGCGPYPDQTWAGWIKHMLEGRRARTTWRTLNRGTRVQQTHEEVDPVLIRLHTNRLSRPRSIADFALHVPPFTKSPKVPRLTLAQQLKAANAALNLQMKNNSKS